MKERSYYSVRTGSNKKGVQLDLATLLTLFHTLHSQYESEGFFQQKFGFECIDGNYVPGEAGQDLDGYVLLKLRKGNLWPIKTRFTHYAEDDLFDIMELLHDNVSKPINGMHHSWNNVGCSHFEEFNQLEGQESFRDDINPLLRDYSSGYELSKVGENQILPEKGMESLFAARLPELDPENVESRIEAAIVKFRRYRSSLEDRRDAVRDLVDVLEFLRPRLQDVLTSNDENELFRLANNFGIRHHRKGQLTEYDKPIWYSWMFYYYLATIHATMRLIKKHGIANC